MAELGIGVMPPQVQGHRGVPATTRTWQERRALPRAWPPDPWGPDSGLGAALAAGVVSLQCCSCQTESSTSPSGPPAGDENPICTTGSARLWNDGPL